MLRATNFFLTNCNCIKNITLEDNWSDFFCKKKKTNVIFDFQKAYFNSLCGVPQFEQCFWCFIVVVVVGGVRV